MLTSKQKATRFTIFTFIALWTVFLVPEVFDLALQDHNYYSNDGKEDIVQGWYGVPYILSSVVGLAYLAINAAFNWNAVFEGK